MKIGGYQKLTLIDFPGVLATTVFTVGCSFRCPFCHNPELVLGGKSSVNDLAEKDFFKFLISRKGKLEGVCITGGEPTIQPDIVEFIRKIKNRGFLVKLDTNGTRPDVLRNILNEKLVDYVAMDVKNTPQKYDVTTGVKGDIERIKLSIELIRNQAPDYEFRTTVVPGLHIQKDILEIAKWLKGSKKYFLQPYREIKILDEKLKQKTKGKKVDLEKIIAKIKTRFEETGIKE